MVTFGRWTVEGGIRVVITVNNALELGYMGMGSSYGWG